MSGPAPSAAATAATWAAVDPVGRPLVLPVTVDDDATPRFSPDDGPGLRAYLAEHGYVVVAGVVPPALCEAAHAAFEREVKGDRRRGYYRLSGRPERHTFTEAGFMVDGLRDVQSLPSRRSPATRRIGQEVVTHPRLAAVIEAALGQPGQVVQTMYFEGNPATQPHQDTYYLDAEPLGAMVAAWIAVEDIAPGAGRFYVCPGSHRTDLPLNGAGYDIVDHYDRYLAAVQHAMVSTPLAVAAPALAQGDVLLWSSRTIHGSLTTNQPERSRRSFTAHYIPASSRFLQWQQRVVPLALDRVNGMPVHHPKDLDRLGPRLRYVAETRFPGAMAGLKRVVARQVLRR